MNYYQASPSTVPHCQTGHGNINKIIYQLLVDHLTPRLQRLPTKSGSEAHHRLAVSLSLSQTTKKVASAPQFSGVQKPKQKQTKK
jgi:hypothetical protein